MKKSLLVLAVVAAFAPVLAQAEAGDIVVRLRATHVSPDVSSKLGPQTDASQVGYAADYWFHPTDASQV